MSTNSLEYLINCVLQTGKIQNFIINLDHSKSSNNRGITNLRKFHNLIKTQLIINSCESIKAKSLLDIACGRGGDIHKLIQAKLKYIFAFDNHSESIYNEIQKGHSFDGAIGRFKQINKISKTKLPFMKFYNIDILEKNSLSKINKLDSDKIYDIVSCQFAFHYFCKNTNSMEHVLSIISKKLKKGGLFIGTATDGDLVHNILSQGNVNIPLLTLLKNGESNLGNLDSTITSNNYLFYITDEYSEKSKKIDESSIRKNYFEIQGVSSEYYLFKEKLAKIALKQQLELVEYKSFYEWYSQLKKEIKSGKSGYTELENMSIYEFVISFLNFSFIFRKI